MDPQVVRDVRFRTASPLRRGYDEQEVDDLLSRIEAGLTQGWTADAILDDLRGVTFGPPPLGRRGYVKAEVDAFLAQVRATLTADGR